MKRLLLIIISTFLISGMCPGQGNYFMWHNWEEGGTGPALPTVTTASITSIMDVTATSGGTVTSDGGAAVTARGVVWHWEINPTLDIKDGITSNGTGTGVFTSYLTGLTCSYPVYVRAYATNSAGTSYGENVLFTPSYMPPVVVSLFYYITTDNCGSFDFMDSFALACEALNIWKNWASGNSMGCMNPGPMGPGGFGYGFRGESFNVGVQLYRETGGGSGLWCKETNTGYFISLSPSYKVVYLVNGVIQSISDCP